MKRPLSIFCLLAAGCASTPERPAESTAGEPATENVEFVTRQAPPMVPRPQRTAGTRSVPTAEELARVKELLTAAASTSEVINAVALDWSDGDRSVFATHLRYPAEELTEEAREATIDYPVIEQCEQRFPGCVGTTADCDEEAFESCIRTAYRNPYVYFDVETGQQCAIFELSEYRGSPPEFALAQRRELAALVCDFDALAGAPAATDLDGDGGPELVYSWHAWEDPNTERSWPVESIIVLDANTLAPQYTFTAKEMPRGDTVQTSNMALHVVDRDNDGMKDLVVSRVDITGYCPEMGFALGDEFVVDDDEFASDEPPCDLDVQRIVLPYDPANDVWKNPARGGSEK